MKRHSSIPFQGIFFSLFFCGTFYQFFVCFCGVFSNRFCVVCVFPFLGGFFLAQNLREFFSAQFFSRIFFAHFFCFRKKSVVLVHHTVQPNHFMKNKINPNHYIIYIKQQLLQLLHFIENEQRRIRQFVSSE